MISNNEIIESLISWRGGWAARALFEDAITRHLMGIDQEVKLAQNVLKASSGQSALRYLTKYSHLTGIDLPIDNIPIDLDVEPRSSINLDKMAESYPLGYFSNIWMDKLCCHLRCSKKNLYFKIQNIFQLDTHPDRASLNLIKPWSWPLIRTFLPFNDQENLELEFRKENLAFLCWRFWYRDYYSKVFLIDTPDLSNQKFSEWFVLRLIHDATHLLHMTCYPNAGSSLNPEWLMVMESAAMYVEDSYAELLLKNDGQGIPNIENFDVYKVSAHVLIGLLERALRVDFDIMVHLEKHSFDDWFRYLNNKFGFGPTISSDFTGGFFDFTYEFHGLPGLGSVYMVGIEALKRCKDKEAVLKGEKPLDYF